MQYPIVYVILKRLRAPLIMLILAYTVAIAGMSIIPGIDENGDPIHLTIFQSFYFISYVATTIGFGEIPYDFTDTQRLWVVFCIYLTVISWLVAIGNIISLLQDPALKSVWRRQNFTKQTRRISEKFFIICGYGETGEMLLEHLGEKGYQCVVVDNNPDRINLLDLDSSIYNVPYLLGDVSDAETLKMAGLENEHCRAVLAVTNDDRINVKVAVTAKVLRSGIKVICRVNTKEAMANAKSFDTNHVINPSRIYAEGFSRAFRTPSIYQATTSLLRRAGKAYIAEFHPPKGHWIICGYNEFGQEMVRYLEYEGMDYTIISDDENLVVSHVNGRGTEAVTLRAANIERSVGIVAGTDDDTDNLSIIMTARHLKPNLFLVARQNHESNSIIFDNVNIDSIMESSRLMMWRILPLITKPKLATFLRLARHQDEEWGKSLMKHLKALSDRVPATYLLKVNERKAPALISYLASGNILRLQDLFVEEDGEERPIALPLMLIRDGNNELLPKFSTAIKHGDTFLIASREKALEQLQYTVAHEQDFHYVIHGEEKPVSIVMHMIRKQLKEHKQRKRHRKQEKLKKFKLKQTQEQEKVATQADASDLYESDDLHELNSTSNKSSDVESRPEEDEKD